MNSIHKGIVATVAMIGIAGLQPAQADMIFEVLPNPGSPAAIFNWETDADFSADGAPGQGNGVGSANSTVSGGTFNTPVSDVATHDILSSVVEGGSPTPLSGATDWVLSVKAEVTPNIGFTRVFAAAWDDGATFGDIMQLDLRATPNTYRVLAGPGGFSELIEFTPTATGSITWQLHYKSSSNLLDLYADTELVLADFSAANNPPGDFGFETARLVSNGFDAFSFDHFLVSNNFVLVPEPGTLTLVAMGAGLIVFCRRKLMRG